MLNEEVNEGKKILAKTPYDIVDGFYKRLELVRQAHYAKHATTEMSQPFTSDSTVIQGEEIKKDPINTLISQLQKLQTSKYISATGITYFNNINVPSSGELLDLINFPQNEDEVITQVENICPHDSNFSNFSNRSNRSNRSNDSPVFGSRTFSHNIF